MRLQGLLARVAACRRRSRTRRPCSHTPSPKVRVLPSRDTRLLMTLRPGLFAGLSLEGTVLIERKDANRDFTGLRYLHAISWVAVFLPLKSLPDFTKLLKLPRAWTRRASPRRLMFRLLEATTWYLMRRVINKFSVEDYITTFSFGSSYFSVFCYHLGSPQAIVTRSSLTMSVLFF